MLLLRTFALLTLTSVIPGCLGVSPYVKPKRAPYTVAEIEKAFSEEQTPQPEHALLHSLVGAWSGEFRKQLSADSPQSIQTVTADAELRFGDKFVEFRYKTDSLDGVMYFGYELPNYNYVVAQVGSELSQLRSLRGAYNAQTKELKLFGGYQTPLNGDRVNVECRLFLGENRVDIVFYEKDKRLDKLFKSSEFHLERKATAHSVRSRP